MGADVLNKVISYYKQYCMGALQPQTIKDEMLAVKLDMDRRSVNKQSQEDLELYYAELEYLLFDVLKYE